jgi:hypothetical protein
VLFESYEYVCVYIIGMKICNAATHTQMEERRSVCNAVDYHVFLLYDLRV